MRVTLLPVQIIEKGQFQHWTEEIEINPPKKIPSIFINSIILSLSIDFSKITVRLQSVLKHFG